MFRLQIICRSTDTSLGCYIIWTLTIIVMRLFSIFVIEFISLHSTRILFTPFPHIQAAFLVQYIQVRHDPVSTFEAVSGFCERQRFVPTVPFPKCYPITQDEFHIFFVLKVGVMLPRHMFTSKCSNNSAAHRLIVRLQHESPIQGGIASNYCYSLTGTLLSSRSTLRVPLLPPQAVTTARDM